MWIKRDLETVWHEQGSLPVRVLTGLRQCGKSSLLEKLLPKGYRHCTLDDLQLRKLVQTDPALFFEQNPWPIVVDEAQYAPNLFSEIKLRVDRLRNERTHQARGPIGSPVWLTGSNQFLMDKQVKETLAGRASFFQLHTLSVHELSIAFQHFELSKIFIRGGWPELYVDEAMPAPNYLNDYVDRFLEKEIVASAGIQKASTFSQVLGLLAARTAQILNISEIAQPVGIEISTVSDWLSILERNQVIYRLPTYQTNLTKRLIKSPKVYFLDVGLASRLQGWSETSPLLKSPQGGPLFETLVLGEIIRTKDHLRKNWKVSYWRTKEQEEIDFLVQNENGAVVALEAKLGISSVKSQAIPKLLQKTIPNLMALVIVSYGGEQRKLSRGCIQLPLQNLFAYLRENL